MGGSSLAAEVIARVAAPGARPRFTVLDSTDPDTIRALTARLDPARTLFLVASKSGPPSRPCPTWRISTPSSPAWRPDPGSAFVAVTDAGSPAGAAAAERRFARVFLNPADIGGGIRRSRCSGWFPRR
jgi:glucose-6-phosphate isomerase